MSSASPVAFFVSPYFLHKYAYMKAVRSRAALFEGEVLDVGCGNSPFRHLFPKAARIVGVDVEGRGHSHEGEAIDVFFDGRRLPFPDGSFDGAVAFDVLEHVPEPAELLAEIRRVLRKGGRVLFTTPFMVPEHEVPYDFRRWTSYGLRRRLECSGFQVEEVVRVGNTPSVFLFLLAYRLHRCLFFLPRFVRPLFAPFLLVPCHALGLFFSLFPAGTTDSYMGLLLAGRARG